MLPRYEEIMAFSGIISRAIWSTRKKPETLYNIFFMCETLKAQASCYIVTRMIKELASNGTD